MEIIQCCQEARQQIWSMRASGASVGLVPTMGALHAGHLSLVQRSVQTCDHTVASIFVNPTQFGPHEDLEKYPRTFQEDCRALERAGVSMVFAPTNEEMYPDGYSTFVDPPEVAKPLEGVCRPGHFRGVTTVVMKLFQILPTTHAFFGRKDYQQFKVIQAMVRDLNVGIEIIAAETIREPDGLALSSRNRYLSTDDRLRALALSAALATAQKMAASGQRDVAAIQTAMRQRLLGSDLVGGVDRIDYATIVDASNLLPMDTLDRPAVALIAAHVGHTRLIDNRPIDGV